MARLASHGLARDTPIAVASSLSQPKQRLWRGTLGDLPGLLAEAGDSGLVILGVGTAFGQHDAVAVGSASRQRRSAPGRMAAADHGRRAEMPVVMGRTRTSPMPAHLQ